MLSLLIFLDPNGHMNTVHVYDFVLACTAFT